MDPPSHRVSSYHLAPPTYNQTYKSLLAEMGTGMNRTLVSNMKIQKNSNSKDEEIKNLKKKLAALEADKIDSLCSETHEDYYMKSANCKPEPFDMQHAMKQLQNMYSGLVGDGIKYATTRIAQSLRDFIMSIYEDNEEYRRMNEELRRKYKNENNNVAEGEQPVTINYVCLCKVYAPKGPKGHRHIDVRGYVYLITTHAVYRSVIDIWTGDKKEYTPSPFQRIYEFEEHESVNNVRNNVLISYCKRNILMVKSSDEPGNKGRCLEDIVKFCINLESIFRVFYNPDPPIHEEAEDAYKMGRMISAHPGMTEEESIAETLKMQKIRKEAKFDMKKRKENGNNGYDGVNNGLARPWTYKGEKVFRTYNGHVFRRNSENEVGNYMGKYNKSTNILDTSVENPYD